MRIYKRIFGGKPSKNWFCRWRNHLTGKWVYWVGYPDKQSTEALADSMERLSARVATGNEPEPQMITWLSTLDQRHLKMVEKLGLVRPKSFDGPRRIDQQLEHYESHLSLRSKPKHVNFTMKSLREIVDFCNWTNVSEMNAEGLLKYTAAKQKGVTPRTLQFKIWTAKGFARWMQRNGAIPSNPFESVSPPSPERAKVRRMLLPDEWEVLAKYTKKADKAKGQEFSPQAPTSEPLYRPTQ